MTMTISADTKFAAVLGWPVHHSKSPAMHNAAFASADIDAVYLAFAVAPDKLQEAVAGLRSTGALGANLTVPHKEAGLALCDSLSDAARTIGAVNTLVFGQDGHIVGHNTDAAGYVRSLTHCTGQSATGLRVVLLGGGGAARAVSYGLLDAGATSVSVVARSPDKVAWTKALPWKSGVLASHLPECDLLVDCTSIGLSEESESRLPCPIDLSLLPSAAIVSTLVYHRETNLLRDARALGHKVFDGREMLVAQGALAFELWTGVAPQVDLMRAAAFS